MSERKVDNFLRFQRVLIEQVSKLVPNQDKPIRFSDKEQEEWFCYGVADIFAKANVLARHSYKTYVFNGTFYDELDLDGMKHFIYDTVYQSGVELNEKMCRIIIKEILIRIPEYKEIPNDERYTLFQNGYVDNQTGQFFNYVPDYFPTMCIEAEYIPGQQLFHPTMDKFLDDISGGDPILIKRLWEVIGYCISSDAAAKRIFVLFGESGDNGKSTFLNFISSLITPSGVIQMNITTLTKGCFSLSELDKKRIEFSADEGDLNLDTTQMGKLKNISGRDWISAEVKHKKQIRFFSTCKILIASNHNIGVAYTASDYAFSRRICSLPFDVKIPKEQQDPYLIEKLNLERNAIVTEAFYHLGDLRNRGYIFTGDDIYDNNFNFYPNNLPYDMIGEFSNTCCSFMPGSYTYTDELYQMFINRYGNTIFKDITSFSQAFYRANAEQISKAKKHTTNKNAWGFNGVALKQEILLHN